MELGSATSSVAQYKVSTPLLTLGQVGVRCLGVLKVTLCVEAPSDEVHLFVWFLFFFYTDLTSHFTLVRSHEEVAKMHVSLSLCSDQAEM